MPLQQNTVETSTYGAEIVLGQLGVEAVLEFRYGLRMSGVPIISPTRMLDDNMSVIQNCSWTGIAAQEEVQCNSISLNS